MKANFENLTKVMEFCANAHNVAFGNTTKTNGTNVIFVWGDTIPIRTDVRLIAEAFFGHHDCVSSPIPMATICIEDNFLDEVDMHLLEYALPHEIFKVLK